MNARNVKHRVGVLLIWEQPKDEPRLVHYKVLKQMLECIAKYRNKECLCHTDTRNVQHSKTSMCAMRKKKKENHLEAQSLARYFPLAHPLWCMP